MRIEPLTAERWDDFADLCARMGPNRSCWCMWWRQDAARPGAPARARARFLVEGSPRPPGLIAYEEGRPVGWVAVAPREEYPRLNRGRHTAPVDAMRDVWAIPCLFVVPERRGSGIATALVGAATEFALACGAAAVEGVPGDPATQTRSPSASYTGTTAMFAAHGFDELARRSPRGRVVMRRLARGPGCGEPSP